MSVNAIDRLAATPGYVERSGPAFTAGVGGGGGGGVGGGVELWHAAVPVSENWVPAIAMNFQE